MFDFDFDQFDDLQPAHSDETKAEQVEVTEPALEVPAQGLALEVFRVSGERLLTATAPCRETVGWVKKQLEDHCAVPLNVQKLVLGASVLRDGDALAALPLPLRMTMVTLPYRAEMSSRLLSEARRRRGTTALQEALDASADPNHEDAAGKTAAHFAAEHGNWEALRLLCKARADAGSASSSGATPLLLAAQHGHLAAARFLCEAGVGLDRAAQVGATPLFVASREGHVEMVRLLCDMGADKDAAMKTGATPLLIARKQGHTAVVHVLSMAGACLQGGQRYVLPDRASSRTGEVTLVRGCSRRSGLNLRHQLPNLALRRPVEASSAKSEVRSPCCAVDGRRDTRWTSAYADQQWLAVDLGARRPIASVDIKWEAAYAEAYLLQVSSGGGSGGDAWQTLAAEAGREGWVSTILPHGSEARWVRVYCLNRATEFGFSIWELQVRGAAVTWAEDDATEP